MACNCENPDGSSASRCYGTCGNMRGIQQGEQTVRFSIVEDKMDRLTAILEARSDLITRTLDLKIQENYTLGFMDGFKTCKGIHEDY